MTPQFISFLNASGIVSYACWSFQQREDGKAESGDCGGQVFFDARGGMYYAPDEHQHDGFILRQTSMTELRKNVTRCGLLDGHITFSYFHDI